MAAEIKAKEEAELKAKEEAEAKAREEAEAKAKAMEEAEEKVQQDAAAVKMQNLKRAKDARAKVDAKREELRLLEEESKLAYQDTKDSGAPPTLTQALLDVASGEDADKSATMLQSLQRQKTAKAKVDEKRKSLLLAQGEAAKLGGSMDGTLKNLLDEAAGEGDDEEKGKEGEGKGGGGEEQVSGVVRYAKGEEERTARVAKRRC